jgi:hypothetical protein
LDSGQINLFNRRMIRPQRPNTDDDDDDDSSGDDDDDEQTVYSAHPCI